MFRKNLIVVLAAAVVGMGLWGGTGNALAHEEHEGGTGPTRSVESAKKEICPVSGEEVAPGTAISREFQGRTYRLCCADCLEKFKTDPEKYIGKVKEEAAEPAEEPEHHGRHGHH